MKEEDIPKKHSELMKVIMNFWSCVFRTTEHVRQLLPKGISKPNGEFRRGESLSLNEAQYMVGFLHSPWSDQGTAEPYA